MLCTVEHLGTVRYAEGLEIQRQRVAARKAGTIPDTLLLLEHSHVYTLGRNAREGNILVSRRRLASLGAEVFETDRGGDVTYHGPGQLVIYPIIDLRQRGRDIHAYVHDLEEVVIRSLASFSIAGEKKSHAGVWVGDKQIAAIGIAIRRWITMHGIALNVSPKPAHFKLINPCGMAGVPVTSIRELTGVAVPLTDVADIVVAEFASVFHADIQKTATAEIFQ